jgi:hypothetical protein
MEKNSLHTQYRIQARRLRGGQGMNLPQSAPGKNTPQLSKKTRPGCQGVSLILLLSSSFAQEITI